ncbi:MAG: twin-arginine translocase subunit TatC [Chitinophagaceae bacterium]|nr:twin-arginine translocase subunit TatC [Chitinophagaceae bacterium]
MSFVDHLEALRWHIVRSVVAVFVFAILIFLNIDWIFLNVIMGPTQSDFISYKLLCSLGYKLGLGDSFCMPPIDMELQVTTVSGTFMSSISIAFVSGLIAAFPYLCWEVWRFVKPALKENELKHTRGIIFWISFFFFIGAAFGYFLLAPFTFNFLYNYTLGSKQVLQYRPMLSDYLDSIIDITLGSGVAFELPMASWILARIGILTPGFLRTYRKYAYVALLVLAAIITPSPDWGSQMIVCVPLILLYEISIIIAARVSKKQEKKWEEWS